MKQLFPILAVAALVFTLSAFPAKAQEAAEIVESCIQIFGGGNTCYQSETLLINKTVLRPGMELTQGQTLQDQDFIENTPLSEPYTSANSLTAFRLYVTNNTDEDLTTVTVIDRLPERYATYVTSDGVYNENTKTVTFELDNLPSGETRALTIQVMTAMSTALPTDPVCTVNQAHASTTKEGFLFLPDEISESQDNTRLCITQNENGGTLINGQNNNGVTNGTQPTPTTPTQNGANQQQTKGGLPVTSPTPIGETPNTGAESLALIGLLPAGAAGYFLRRKTK